MSHGPKFLNVCCTTEFSLMFVTPPSFLRSMSHSLESKVCHTTQFFPMYVTKPRILRCHTTQFSPMFVTPSSFLQCTVNRQNIIGIYITPLTLIQFTVHEQNIVCNNWWLKLQPAVILQNWSITAGCNSNNQLLQTRFCLLQPAVILTSDCWKQYFVHEQ